MKSFLIFILFLIFPLGVELKNDADAIKVSSPQNSKPANSNTDGNELDKQMVPKKSNIFGKLSPKKLMSFRKDEQVLHLDLSYSELMFLEAFIVNRIRQFLIRPLVEGRVKITKYKTNTVYQIIDEIYASFPSAEEETKWQNIFGKFTQYLKEKIESYKKEHDEQIAPESVVIFQLYALLMLGESIFNVCLNEYKLNQNAMVGWWRSFRYELPTSKLIDYAPGSGNDQPQLRQPLLQYCIWRRKYYRDNIKSIKKKGSELRKHLAIKVPKDLIQINLHVPEYLTEDGASFNPEAMPDQGENKDAAPIFLALYQLQSYDFIHPSVIVGKLDINNFVRAPENCLEVHYSTGGIRVTKLGDFDPKKLKFIKVLMLKNVTTKFSVRQIELALDYLALNYKKHDDINENCVHFISELINLISAERQNDTYPPETLNYTEYPVIYESDDATFKISNEGEEHRVNWKNNEFLNKLLHILCTCSTMQLRAHWVTRGVERAQLKPLTVKCLRPQLKIVEGAHGCEQRAPGVLGGSYQLGGRQAFNSELLCPWMSSDSSFLQPFAHFFAATIMKSFLIFILFLVLPLGVELKNDADAIKVSSPQNSKAANSNTDGNELDKQMVPKQSNIFAKFPKRLMSFRKSHQQDEDVLHFDLSYSELMFLEAFIVNTIRQFLIRPLVEGRVQITKYKTNTVYQIIDAIYTNFRTKEGTKLKNIFNKFTQYLKEKTESYKKEHDAQIAPESVVFFQFDALLMLGESIFNVCLNEYKLNQNAMVGWWLSFRYELSTSKLINYAPESGNDQPQLRQPLLQYCIWRRKYYRDNIQCIKKKGSELRKYFAIKVPKHLIQINLHVPEYLTENGASFNPEDMPDQGENQDAAPIFLALYQLQSYDVIHPSVIVGKLDINNFDNAPENCLEVHYSTGGIRVTKLGDFGDPKKLKFIKVLRLKNVTTKFSVRQIESVLDYLALNYKKYDDINENCVHFISELINLISAERQNGTYPPETLNYTEYPVIYGRYAKTFNLSDEGKEHSVNWENNEFLKLPKIIVISKKLPKAAQSVVRQLTNLFH
uniref:PPPDE domain-containing protein n=1 Tax=Globodera rostochiensis TaxID=31243 RepID=A0A914I2L0_GLORO